MKLDRLQWLQDAALPFGFRFYLFLVYETGNFTVANLHIAEFAVSPERWILQITTIDLDVTRGIRSILTAQPDQLFKLPIVELDGVLPVKKEGKESDRRREDQHIKHDLVAGSRGFFIAGALWFVGCFCP